MSNISVLPRGHRINPISVIFGNKWFYELMTSVCGNSLLDVNPAAGLLDCDGHNFSFVGHISGTFNVAGQVWMLSVPICMWCHCLSWGSHQRAIHIPCNFFFQCKCSRFHLPSHSSLSAVLKAWKFTIKLF